MSEDGDSQGFTPQSTAIMDAMFWGGAHGIAFVATLLLAWLTNLALALIAFAVSVVLLITLTLWWTSEFEDWWDDFKATNRTLLLGLPAAIITPSLGLFLGSVAR